MSMPGFGIEPSTKIVTMKWSGFLKSAIVTFREWASEVEEPVWLEVA